ncbi:two-component system, chemotaxis family, sensor kinase CheA [Evansella caseinilytica]|uniref:Chemotaxis protein CheA n=1 Tax=Evansella caseinilytica TaxID=1503961 RepID=A0A1H3M3Z9_9BACI|nr:chemotaxis protein CheA [Evansella caseinilytica]SDY71323.1 two-component system, chemotaxis family, sensor kinase CheA [Evansella caseinilytica]
MEMNQYMEMFIEESKEHLQAMNEHLLKLESNPEDGSLVNEIFRSAHTLKGMSATMGFEDLASLTHQMENVLDGIRNNEITATSDLLDVVFESVDHLEEMVVDIEGGGDGKRDVSDTVSKLKLIEEGAPQGSLPAVGSKAGAEQSTATNAGVPSFDTFEHTVLAQSKEQGYNAYFINIALREDCILKAARVYMVFEVLEQLGEVIKSYPTVDQLEEENFEREFSVTIVTKDTAADVENKIAKVSEIEKVEITDIHLDELGTSKDSPADEKKETEADSSKRSQAKSDNGDNGDKKQAAANKTIRVNIDRLDRLMNLFEELVIDRGRLEQISRELKSGELTDTVEHMSRISGDLQSIILNMRMVPVEQVFNRFPRMIRGLAKELNKKVELEIIGAETELDRTVIDEIGDPLVHLLRNSIDHGIESMEERRKKGKEEQGKITLKAYHSGNHVFIEVSDNGSGINSEKVLEKALERGVVTEEISQTMTKQQIYELLFSSGFSTAEQISDISGRGVGLDVVKNKIESLGGNVSVNSEEGEGTQFSIQLPLTLSIISVMLVEVQDEIYAIPLSSIIETAIIKEEEILSAHNQRVIDFRGNVVPLIDLTEFLDVPRTREDDEYCSIVVVRKGEKVAALVVNSFIGQQEIVLKSLGNYLTSVFAVSGATILGNGNVALILDCNSLIK